MFSLSCYLMGSGILLASSIHNGDWVLASAAAFFYLGTLKELIFGHHHNHQPD